MATKRKTSSAEDLLSAGNDALRPLAERMRPRTLDEMVGQRRLLASNSALRRAVELVRRKRPDIAVDGEMQADSAVVPSLIEDRFPFSQVKDANILVFPDLQAANVAYKLLARLGFKVVESGPLVRSSYHADRQVDVLEAVGRVDHSNR